MNTGTESRSVTSDRLQAACRYIERGLPIVLCRGKKPLGKRWQHRTWTAKQVQAAFRGNPSLNVGLILGPRSGVIDIEADTPEHAAALAALFDGEPPRTPTWRARRGTHHLFCYPAELAESIGKAVFTLDGLPEIRLGTGGLGAQSVLPPSETDGVRREWIVSLDDCEPAALPDAVIQRVAAANQPEPKPATTPHYSNGQHHAGDRDIERARKYLAKLPPAISGQNGSGACFRAACVLVCGFALDREPALTLLREFSERCEPPWSEYELAHKVDGAFKQPGERGYMLRGEPERTYRHNGHHAATTATAPRNFNTTDLGNAERFVAQHGANVRYCFPWSTWLHWDGRRWKVDETGAAERLAQETARGIWREAADCSDGDKRKSLGKWAATSEAAERVAAMLKLARSQAGVPVLPAELDAKPWLFCCANGTIDLKTGILLPHDRGHLLTKLSAVEYLTGPEGECPLWESTIETILGDDAELVQFVRRLLGYSLIGEVIEHVLPIFWGSGSNGKSRVTETMLGILGEYAGKASPDLLLTTSGDTHPTEKTDLFGRRLVFAVETDEGRRLSEAVAKEITGGDTVKARRMRENFWEFRPSHTVILVTNCKPRVKGTDHSVWRRLRLVPFLKRFWDASRGESGPPELQADKGLEHKLRAEYGGILNWLVGGCLDWQRHGLGEPEKVKAATAEYRAAEDVLAEFIDETCIMGAGHSTRATDVRRKLDEWCKANGERSISTRRLGEYLAEQGIVKRKSNGTWYEGLMLA